MHRCNHLIHRHARLWPKRRLPAAIQNCSRTANFGSSGDSPETAAKENENGSVFHVFAFRWKPNTSEAEKDRAAKEIAAFQGQIPGLLQTHVGPNISPRGKGYTFGGIMQFKDKASLDAYFQHPTHQALLAWLVPLIDAVELDLQA